MRNRFSVFLLVFWLLFGGLGRAAVPESPSEWLGFGVGEERRLADWTQIVDYFRYLGRTSGRVQVETLGPTTLNNPFLLATISASENLSKLEHYRQVQADLADPRRLGAAAQSQIAEGRVVVLITCAIHSTEVASAQMSMEFAWEMATLSDSETQQILENVIFLLVPSLNPDGIDIVNHWYRDTLGSEAEGTAPPQLYHHYVGHDNNRDWYMFTQRETRLTVSQIHNRWHPQIVYDVHQMGRYGARIFVPPFIDPIDRNVDPILQAQIVDLGGAMFSALVGAGRQGVVTNAIYDAFTPARAYQHYHGAVRILSESASARLATSIEVQPQQLGQGRNYHAGRASWNFPDPWPGGSWSVRDIVEDQKIALRTCLRHAARNRTQWLRNFVEVGRRATSRQRPFAFVLPPAGRQRDPQALADLLEVLDFAQVEIHRAEEPFQVSSVKNVSSPLGEPRPDSFPAGTLVVLLRQPYSSFAKTMLEVQDYPQLAEYPGGPLKRPYDVTAHTLGIQLGVEVYQVEDAFEVPLSRVETMTSAAPEVSGKGNFWLFPHSDNGFAKLANRLLKAGYPLYWAPNGFQAETEGFPVGTLMTRGPEREIKLLALLQDLTLSIRRVNKRPQLAWQRIRAPRIGLYRSHAAAMDEGWTRWVLEQNEFEYSSLSDARIRKGDLGGLDIIVLADQSAESIKHGLSAPYPERYRGGLGDRGVGQLRRFARQGGTLLFLGAASELALTEWDLGVKNPLADLAAQEFYVPGSLLRLQVSNRHPIGYGLAPEVAAMFVHGQVFEFERAVSVARYGNQDLLLSGWMNGQKHLQGRSAVIEVPLGKGRLVLVGFRCQFRAQARATYKLLFNTLYYSTTG